MAEIKKNKKRETPKMKVLDRRHWVDESEESNDKDTANKPIEERLPNFVENLKNEAEEKDKKLREYIAAYKDKNAENDAFRIRLQKENETRLDQFKAILFARLVPILDNLKRAALSSSQSKDLDSLQQGINLVINQFSNELKENGVETVSSVGEKFDPKSHEVFLTVETEDKSQDELIVEELETGYRFKEKLIKAAKVKIAKLKK
ncbi:MAG: nucleotide exchange factor GrpE [Nitrospina sp.]|nr:nucleotide exchange factor GrpE [Nitrospina sp.]